MAPPAWPMYMPSYMPSPLTQLPFMQAQFEEFARLDLEERVLEVQPMSRTHNLKAVENAGDRSATSTRGSKRTHGQEQAPEHCK